jgi:2-amino-4-hydroxy-6-hydroxymethyldihydropteridine diphosphokinase
MHNLILILGSNLGDRKAYLCKATKRLEKDIGKILQHSCLYESMPWGFQTRYNFLNRVLILETDLSPEDILEKIHLIEDDLGRTRDNGGYSSRTIDIDILFIDKLVINKENLVVPHPLIEKRRFVLEPLSELIPDFTHPVLNKDIVHILDECEDKNSNMKFEPEKYICR